MLSMDRDQVFLIVLKFLRMLAFGQTTIIMVPYFSSIDASDQQIGWFMTLTLLGDVALSTVVTHIADGWGRRRMLVVGSAAMAVSGLIFAFSRNYWVLLFAAIIGVISPSGDEIGPFRAIEESTLAHLTVYHHRPKVYAWQNMLGSLGLALGTLSAGFLEDFLKEQTGSSTKAYQTIFLLYSALAVIMLVLNASLSEEAELRDEPEGAPSAADIEAAAEAADTPEITQPEDAEETTPLVHRDEQDLQDAARPKGSLTLSLSFLFGIDSLAYGFMTSAWVVEYLERTFGTSPTLVGQFFFAGCFLAAISSHPSATLTHKVGPVIAIALTKVLAAGLALVVPFETSASVVIGSLLVRALFETMDVVPRQTFLTSIVPNRDRTRVLGLVNVIKTLARSVGPVFTGALASYNYLWVCFVILAVFEFVFAFLIVECFLPRSRATQS